MPELALKISEQERQGRQKALMEHFKLDTLAMAMNVQG